MSETGGRYDAIVIGAGANGLVSAHYLARAGKRVSFHYWRGDSVPAPRRPLGAA